MYVSPFSQRVFTMVNDEISLMRARRKIQEILGKSLQGSFLESLQGSFLEPLLRSPCSLSFVQGALVWELGDSDFRTG